VVAKEEDRQGPALRAFEERPEVEAHEGVRGRTSNLRQDGGRVVEDALERKVFADCAFEGSRAKERRGDHGARDGRDEVRLDFLEHVFSPHSSGGSQRGRSPPLPPPLGGDAQGGRAGYRVRRA